MLTDSTAIPQRRSVWLGHLRPLRMCSYGLRQNRQRSRALVSAT